MTHLPFPYKRSFDSVWMTLWIDQRAAIIDFTFGEMYKQSLFIENQNVLLALKENVRNFVTFV